MAVENDIVEIIISEESWHSGQTELELHWKYKNYEAKLNEWEFFFLFPRMEHVRELTMLSHSLIMVKSFLFSLIISSTKKLQYKIQITKQCRIEVAKQLYL